MAKVYSFKFAPGNPSGLSGLFPTFIIFNAGATAIPGPGITSTGNGFYQFSYGPTLPAVSYVIDGGSPLASLDRYIAGVLDPIQAIDQQIGFVMTDTSGSTAGANTLASLFKRLVDQREGDQSYSKTLGIWKIFSQGSSALLRTKQVSDSNTSSTITGSG